MSPLLLPEATPLLAQKKLVGAFYITLLARQDQFDVMYVHEDYVNRAIMDISYTGIWIIVKYVYLSNKSFIISAFAVPT